MSAPSNVAVIRRMQAPQDAAQFGRRHRFLQEVRARCFNLVREVCIRIGADQTGRDLGASEFAYKAYRIDAVVPVVQLVVAKDYVRKLVM